MELNEGPGSRPITVVFMAGLLIVAFFMLFAYFFLGQTAGPARLATPGSSWRSLDDDEVVAPLRVPGPEPRPAAAGLPVVARGEWIPQTEAERRYFAAIDKVRRLDADADARSARQDTLLAFLDSPLGQNLSATFELARRGQTEDAKRFIEQLLKDVASQDLEVQKFILQSAVSIYAHDKDRAGLARLLTQYLTFLKTTGIAAKGGDAKEPGVDEWLRQLETKQGELERGKP